MSSPWRRAGLPRSKCDLYSSPSPWRVLIAEGIRKGLTVFSGIGQNTLGEHKGFDLLCEVFCSAPLLQRSYWQLVVFQRREIPGSFSGWHRGSKSIHVSSSSAELKSALTEGFFILFNSWFLRSWPLRELNSR